MKIKDKIKKWLFGEELKRLEILEISYKEQIQWCQDRADDYYRMAVTAERKSERAISLADDCRKTMNKVCEVGTDIGFAEDHSWAVICINGKREYVKFIPLEHKDAREVLNFLERFKYSKHIIDSPLAFRHMIQKELFI